MTDVRTMKVQGTKIIDTVQKQLSHGHQAQGFALAQTIIAGTISTAMQLRRAVETAFDYSIEARDAALKSLGDWKKELNQNAKANGNLAAGGMDEKSAGRIARSAGTRVSEFTAIIKAMNNGFTRQTLLEKTGVEDVENIGFHTIVELTRMFNQTGASTGRGRPADPFAVKLAKWLNNQKPEGDDAEVKARVINMLAEVLPHEDAEPISEVVHQRRETDQPAA